MDRPPIEYQTQLETAVINLDKWGGLNVSLFNLPLCLLRPSLYQFAKKINF